MTNDHSNGSAGGGGNHSSSPGIDAILDHAERITSLFRAHLDTFGETIRATRAIEGLDRPDAARALGQHLKDSAPLIIEFGEKLRANGIALCPHEDSSPGYKRGDPRGR